MTDDDFCSGPTPTDTTLRLICGAWVSRAIHVALSLGIPDLLCDGPESSAALAAACGTHAPSLHRLLRALTVEGVFAMDSEGRFRLTPVGEILRSDAPGSLRDWALLMLGDVHGGAWGELLTAVQTGESAFKARYGKDLWAYCREHKAHGALFDRAMAGFTDTYVASVLTAFSFAGFRTIVDVGGGDGSLLVGILSAHHAARGVVFDLASVAERALRRVADAGLSDRCAVVSGDALTEVPAGGDAYVLSRVLHDWDDGAAIRLLGNCQAVLKGDGRVLVLERIVPAQPEDFLATPGPILSDTTLTDMNMMVMTTGRERTLPEYESLFAAAGLQLVRTVATATAMQVMELRRADSDPARVPS
jgi:SAM-dependent methyltransferase